MEATALPASVGVARGRIAIGASLLRIRSDEQLVTLFRAGHDDAFRVIHDRYRPRLFAYTRQMLNGTSQDPEDAVQEIFMRAYYGLRANERELALRAWLYRIAHNRCVDELRRPHPVAVEMIDGLVTNLQDPVVKVEQRDALRRLIADVQRLPGAAALGVADARAVRNDVCRRRRRDGRLGRGRQVAAGSGASQPRPGQRGAQHGLC